MHELDCDSRADRVVLVWVGREEDEERTEAFTAGREGLGADLGDETRPRGDSSCELILELLEVGVEPWRGADRGQRAHRATPVCSATMPPAKRRQRISSNPASSISFPSACGSGKRRTLAGRYE